MKTKIYSLIFFLILFYAFDALGQGDGYITEDGKRLFTIGMYYMPKEDQKLKELAEAGFNIIRCRSKEDLDRLHSFGLKGWLPLKLQHGVTDEFKDLVNSVVDHPALVLWEGPDEIAHHLTAYSGLFRDLKVHEKEGAWGKQTPGAVKYAEEQSSIVIPNMISAISYIRSVDNHNRQVWINEASNTDVRIIRQYLDFIDVTGCDNYPIGRLFNKDDIEIRESVNNIKRYTQRYVELGRGKPVYMVLQAFSWPELGGRRSDRPYAYPSFKESRYMAYIAIAYGAKGINYWGSHYSKNEEFLQSIYAVASELAALQPFLISPQNYIRIGTVPAQGNSVSCFAGRLGRDWLIVAINETDSYQLGVVVENLKHLNGMKLVELYGDEEVTVSNEEIVLRMKPREVKVFATNKKWETDRVKGRDYAGN